MANNAELPVNINTDQLHLNATLQGTAQKPLQSISHLPEMLLRNWTKAISQVPVSWVKYVWELF